MTSWSREPDLPVPSTAISGGTASRHRVVPEVGQPCGDERGDVRCPVCPSRRCLPCFPGGVLVAAAAGLGDQCPVVMPVPRRDAAGRSWDMRAPPQGVPWRLRGGSSMTQGRAAAGGGHNRGPDIAMLAMLRPRAAQDAPASGTDKRAASRSASFLAVTLPR